MSILERCHCSCRFTTATLTIWWHALKRFCRLLLQNLKAVASKCCHNMSQPVSVTLFFHDSMFVNVLFFMYFMYFWCSPAVWQLAIAKHGLKMTKEHKYNGRMLRHLWWRHKECLLSLSNMAGLLQHLRSSCSQELVHACRMTTPFMFDVFIYYLLLKQLCYKEASSTLPVPKSANSRSRMVERCRWCREA